MERKEGACRPASEVTRRRRRELNAFVSCASLALARALADNLAQIFLLTKGKLSLTQF